MIALRMSFLIACFEAVIMATSAFAAGGSELDPRIEGPTWTAPGQWRTRVQQIFDPATRTLTRRTYTIWDPEPSRDLDFVWTPDDPKTDKPGRINGRGHLLWRVKGGAAYERSSIRAEYRGALRDGRIEGRGAYLDHTGLHYEGEWRAGLMHGAGTLKLPSGDEYTGQFRAGKANSQGRFTDVTGEVFEGQFVDGYRNGSGKTTLPNGYSYTSRWTGGGEADSSRLVRIAQTGPAAAPGGMDDVRIGVSIDKRLPARTSGSGGKLADDDGYAAYNGMGVLSIRPANPRLVQEWKGKAELPSYLPLPGHIPLTLNIDVQNRSSFPVRVEGIYLDVRTSITDLQPAIELPDVTQSKMTAFTFSNKGWGAAEQAKVHFSLLAGKPASTPTSFAYLRSLGNIERAVVIDLEPEFAAGGARVDLIKQYRQGVFPCRVPIAQSCIAARSYSSAWGTGGQCKPAADACLADLKRTGILGSLAQQVAIVDGEVMVHVAGVLDYIWRDASGTISPVRRPFEKTLPLGKFTRFLEGAEGGDSETITTTTQKLRLDASAYRVAVGHKANIATGRTGRFLVSIEADKSSSHDFTIAVQLSDGREIRSRPINLLYYKPNNHVGSASQDSISELSYPSHELSGRDLRTTKQDDCHEVCKSDGACVAYTVREREKTCTLKASIGSLRIDPHYQSYRKPGSAVPSRSTIPIEMEPRRGQTFGEGGYRIHMRASAIVCQQLCNNDVRCIAYSFYNKTQNCHLHEYIESQTISPDADVESGLKVQQQR